MVLPQRVGAAPGLPRVGARERSALNQLAPARWPKQTSGRTRSLESLGTETSRLLGGSILTTYGKTVCPVGSFGSSSSSAWMLPAAHRRSPPMKHTTRSSLLNRRAGRSTLGRAPFALLRVRSLMKPRSRSLSSVRSSSSMTEKTVSTTSAMISAKSDSLIICSGSHCCIPLVASASMRFRIARLLREKSVRSSDGGGGGGGGE